INSCAASTRVLFGFKNENARALPHDKAITLGVERAAAALRVVVVVSRHGFHITEASVTQASDGGFATASNDYICFAEAQHPQRVANGVASGRACANNRVIGTTSLVINGNLTRSDVGNEHRDHEGGHPSGTAVEQLVRLLLN